MIPNKNSPSLFTIVVSHYLASAICFLILSFMLVFSVDVFTGHYFQPRLLAMTHMAALGWGTLIVFGACYQLLEFILETELFSRKLAWISFGLFLPGLSALIFSFWIFDPGVYMQSGSILLLTSIIIFTINVFFTVNKNKQDSIHQEFIMTSCWWLVFTAIVGTLLVFNFRYAFLPKDHLHFLRLHAHMGIAGWFLLLIIGVSAKVVPMFLVSPYQNNKLLTWSYYLINGALLLFLVDTYYSGINFKTLGIVFTGAVGIGSYLVYLYKCYCTRLRNVMDLSMVNTFFSFILLAVAVVVLPLIVYYHLKDEPNAIRYTTLYGSLLFMGWISALILGQTFKTLPFIVWIKNYEHLNGKTEIPQPANLVKNTLLKIQSTAFLIFCMAFFIGYVASSEIFINIGLICLVCTAILYMVNIIYVLLHKTKTPGYD